MISIYEFPFASCEREPGSELIHLGKRNYQLKFLVDQDGIMEEFILRFMGVVSILVRYQRLWDGSELEYYDKVKVITLDDDFFPKNRGNLSHNFDGLKMYRFTLDDGPFYELVAKSFETE